MRVGLGALLLFIAICCAGCASQPAPPLASAVAPGQAKVSLKLADEGPSIQVAQIAINGAHIADLAPGQTYTGGVPPGRVSLTATQSMGIGHYTVEFNAVPGKTYAFLVSRRSEQAVATIFGGLAGAVLETAASGDQSGAYKITPVQ